MFDKALQSIKNTFKETFKVNLYNYIQTNQKYKVNGKEYIEEKLIAEGGYGYVYEVSEEPKNLNKDNVLSIDLGVDNLATCVSTVGTPFIMDGRKLKSINHRWNKEIARLRSISMKQGLKMTNRIQRITAKRNNQVNDYIKKTARYIINYCIITNNDLIINYKEFYAY